MYGTVAIQNNVHLVFAKTIVDPPLNHMWRVKKRPAYLWLGPVEIGAPLTITHQMHIYLCGCEHFLKFDADYLIQTS